MYEDDHSSRPRSKTPIIIGGLVVLAIFIALLAITAANGEQSFFSPAPTPTWYVTPIPTLYQAWDGVMYRKNNSEEIFIWQEPGIAQLAFKISPGIAVSVVDEKCVDVCYYKISTNYGVGWIDQEFVKKR